MITCSLMCLNYTASPQRDDFILMMLLHEKTLNKWLHLIRRVCHEGVVPFIHAYIQIYGDTLVICHYFCDMALHLRDGRENNHMNNIPECRMLQDWLSEDLIVTYVLKKMFLSRLNGFALMIWLYIYEKVSS